MNVIGEIMPCQRPPRKPAGFAPSSLYFDFDPATESTFAITFLLEILDRHKTTTDEIAYHHPGSNRPGMADAGPKDLEAHATKNFMHDGFAEIP